MRAIGVAGGFAALLAGTALIVGTTASAAVMVVGTGMAQTCSQAAQNRSAISLDVSTCSRALDEELLNDHERSATYNNRGVLHMRRGDRDAALRDFEQAMAFDPAVGEAWVNRGAVRITEERYEEALADTERALALELAQPERAYMNRGIAYEEMGRLREAYADYSRALELRPGWDEAQSELARFQVR